MFTPPFIFTPKNYPGTGDVYLIHDATDQLVATAFNAEAARQICTRLNPTTQNNYVASMLAALRLQLEHDLGAPLTDQPLPIGDVFSTLADWFGLHSGQRAIALGHDTLAYMALQGVGDRHAEAVRIIEVQYA